MIRLGTAAIKQVIYDGLAMALGKQLWRPDLGSYMPPLIRRCRSISRRTRYACASIRLESAFH